MTVCHPFFAFSHKWTSRWYILIIVTFSGVYNVPKFFELKTGVTVVNGTQFPAEGNQTEWEMDEAAREINYSIKPTPMRINEFYIKVRRFGFLGK